MAKGPFGLGWTEVRFAPQSSLVRLQWRLFCLACILTHFRGLYSTPRPPPACASFPSQNIRVHSSAIFEPEQVNHETEPLEPDGVNELRERELISSSATPAIINPAIPEQESFSTPLRSALFLRALRFQSVALSFSLSTWILLDFFKLPPFL